jgi:hypothetical protein
MAKDSWKRCTKCNRKQTSRRVQNLCGPCEMDELRDKRRKERAEMIE